MSILKSDKKSDKPDPLAEMCESRLQKKNFPLGELPATVLMEPSKAERVSAKIFFAIFGLLFLAATVDVLWNVDAKPQKLILIPFYLSFIAFMLYWVVLMLRKTEITIDRHNVNYRHEDLLGVKEWVAPLSTYAGVAFRLQPSQQRSVYAIDLYHGDASKRVSLYKSLSKVNHREVWREYANMLNVDLVEVGGSKINVRKVEDFHKSAKELAQENKLDVSFDLAANPPGKISCKAVGSEMKITMPGSIQSFFMLAIAAIAPIIFAVTLSCIASIEGAASKLNDDIMGISMCMGLFVSVFILVEYNHKPTLLLSSEKIQYYIQSLWGKPKMIEIKCEDVKAVNLIPRIFNNQEHAPEMIQIETDDEIVGLGGTLSKKGRQWLRDCILHVITS